MPAKMKSFKFCFVIKSSVNNFIDKGTTACKIPEIKTTNISI